jgi:4-amino-4-deoxy-L-arabinose transferase-like glycosyltransferase
VGRYLSGIFDLGTIVVVYLTAAHLFPKRKWVALIAALLYACAVLPIQISHFFIVDNFTTFFSSLAIYACVRISLNASPVYSSELPEQFSSRLLNFWRGFREYVLFSVVLGLAAASKINAVVIAFFLPAAVLIAESGDQNKIKFKISKFNFHNIFLAAALSLLVFRIFQPYAFSGPGFFHLIPNPRWINNIRELSILSSGDSN